MMLIIMMLMMKTTKMLIMKIIIIILINIIMMMAGQPVAVLAVLDRPLRTALRAPPGLLQADGIPFHPRTETIYTLENN